MSKPNEPVPAWAAERIIAASRTGQSRRELAKTFKTGEWVVKTILKHHRVHGVARVPRQGQGRRDDPSWVFTGPRVAGNVEILARTAEEEEGDEMYTELHGRLSQEGVIDDHSYESMCRQMRQKLNHSTKRVRRQPASRHPSATPCLRSSSCRDACAAVWVGARARPAALPSVE